MLMQKKNADELFPELRMAYTAKKDPGWVDKYKAKGRWCVFVFFLLSFFV